MRVACKKIYKAHVEKHIASVFLAYDYMLAFVLCFRLQLLANNFRVFKICMRICDSCLMHKSLWAKMRSCRYEARTHDSCSCLPQPQLKFAIAALLTVHETASLENRDSFAANYASFATSFLAVQDRFFFGMT